jgi:hypothetical protein
MFCLSGGGEYSGKVFDIGFEIPSILILQKKIFFAFWTKLYTHIPVGTTNGI